MKKIFPFFIGSIILVSLFIVGYSFLDNLKISSAISTRASDTVIYYEAENADFITNRDNLKDEKASNGEAIFLFNGDIDGVLAYCKFTFNIEKEGYYNLSINSMGSGSDKINILMLDGVSLGENYLRSPQGEWKEQTFLENQYLNAGEHTLTVTPGYGYTYLDYLKIEKMSEYSLKEIYNRTYKLSNRNASPKAQELFNYLNESYGKYIISGQFVDDGFDDVASQRIKEKTGKYPAIVGLDLLALSPSIKELTKKWMPSPTYDKVIELAEDYVVNKGGIVTLCWHWNLDFAFMKTNEDGSYKAAWEAYRTGNVNIDFTAVMENEDSTEYKLIERDMDEIAKELKVLAEKDVPILFRPLHEASGDWFWWSTGSPEAYIKLWRKMYDKYTNEYGLNNLIWVWNGSDPAWYPGDEYVDICGADIYGEKQDYNPRSLDFTQYFSYANGQKMITLSETGTLIDIDKAFNNNTVWLWFLNWKYTHVIPEDDATDFYTSLEMWNWVYNHEKVITLDELPFHTHTDTNDDNICDVCGAEIPKKPDDGNEEEKPKPPEKEEEKPPEKPNENEGNNQPPNKDNNQLPNGGTNPPKVDEDQPTTPNEPPNNNKPTDNEETNSGPSGENNNEQDDKKEENNKPPNNEQNREEENDKKNEEIKKPHNEKKNKIVSISSIVITILLTVVIMGGLTIILRNLYKIYHKVKKNK